jgi:hypothetical protein
MKQVTDMRRILTDNWSDTVNTEDVDGGGALDLLLRFETQETVIGLAIR